MHAPFDRLRAAVKFIGQSGFQETLLSPRAREGKTHIIFAPHPLRHFVHKCAANIIGGIRSQWERM
jgi:hypothetical protein